MSNGFIGAVSARAETSGYTKEQALALFPDKTSATPQDFTAMPTVNGDPVVESGSNADGEWTRWADGTAAAVVDETIDWSTVAVYSRNLPIDFVGNGPSGGFAAASGSAVSYHDAIKEVSVAAGVSGFNFGIRATSGIFANPGKFSFIGRWK